MFGNESNHVYMVGSCCDKALAHLCETGGWRIMLVDMRGERVGWEITVLGLGVERDI